MRSLIENLPDRGSWPLSEIEIEKVLMTAFPSGPIGLRESSSVVESSVSLTHHHLWEFTNLKAKPGQVANNHIDPRANTSSDVHIYATAIQSTRYGKIKELSRCAEDFRM